LVFCAGRRRGPAFRLPRAQLQEIGRPYTAFGVGQMRLFHWYVFTAMSEPNEVCYDRGTLSAPELQRVVDELLSELRDAEDLDALAASAGITANDVRAMRLEITESEASIAPALAFIVVHFAGGGLSVAGGAATKSFWKKVILPRVRKAKRSDAIGNERADQTLG
jgi:hypothetical protein